MSLLHWRTSFSVVGSYPDWLTCSQLSAPSRNCPTIPLWQSIPVTGAHGCIKAWPPLSPTPETEGAIPVSECPTWLTAASGWWHHSPTPPSAQVGFLRCPPRSRGIPSPLMNSCVPIFISASDSPEPSLQQLVPELGCSEETHYIWYMSIYKKYPEQTNL